MRWIIYYGNGQTYCDLDGAPENAPTRDVQVIAVEDPDCGQAYLRSNDYYWWDGDGWNGGDIFGLFDYLIDDGWKKVLFGKTINNADYNRILTEATNNSYLPRKSARHGWERKS